MAGPERPTTGTVRARVAAREDIARMDRSERLAAALWPVPLTFGVVALILARITSVLDTHDAFGLRDDFLVRDPDTALTFASVVASGMLVFLGIVFSTTLVAIQLAGSQYSPRVVRVFLRLRLTKVALGVFVATFAFAIATLVEIRPSGSRAYTPTVSLTVLALLMLATVVTFLMFANGTARLLRVQYLVERIASEARTTFAEGFDTEHEVRARPPAADASPIFVAHTTCSGVLDAVDIADLAEIAAGADGWIEVLPRVGGHVAAGTPLAALHGHDGSHADAVRACFLLSNERTLLEDPGFGLRQLADVAIRGLSPAVNDPTTAVQAIDRITDLLGSIAACPDPSEWYADGNGVARVRMRADDFDDLMRLGFTEIIRYGADAPQVVRRLHAAFDLLEDRSNGRIHPSIAEARTLLGAATADAMPPAFLDLANQADPRGLG